MTTEIAAATTTSAHATARTPASNDDDDRMDVVCVTDDSKALAEEAGIGIVDVVEGGPTTIMKQEDPAAAAAADVVATTDNTDDEKKEDDDESDNNHKNDNNNNDDDLNMKKKVETKEEEEARKERWKDYQYQQVKEPHANDVLYGRGGGTNHHPGNKRYRRMVEDRKVDYVNCKRLDKPLVALDIIRTWRSQEPPGRFLKMDDKTGLWNDVGDKKAREKTSQALREKAPQIRLELEKEKRAKERAERGEGSGEPSDDEEVTLTRTARFVSEPLATTSTQSKKPGMVARGHSLGVDYVDPNEGLGIEGFTWNKDTSTSTTAATVGSGGGGGANANNGVAPPPPPVPYGYSGTMRLGSNGSFGPPSYPPPPMPPPPPQGSYEHWSSWGRYDSWGSVPPGAPPPPMGYSAYPPSLSGPWNPREHSLGQNPLAHATISQAAYPGEFDRNRTPSGHWGPPMPPYPLHSSGGPPPYRVSGGPPPPGAYPHQPPPHPHPHQQQQQQPPSREYSNSGPAGAAPPSPTAPYSVDPAVASQWSGQDPKEIAKTMSGEGSGGEERDTFNTSPISSPRRTKTPATPKPDMVKRATSNQNETAETRPDLDSHGRSVKRAALNREGSLASNRLKAKYVPACFDPKKEVDALTTNFKQSTLNNNVKGAAPKPTSLSKEERLTTLDMSALDLVVKPVAFNGTNRSTTIEALAIDFDDEPLIKVDQMDPMDDVFSDVSDLPKPSALSADQRLTTTDLLDIVNEPLSDD